VYECDLVAAGFPEQSFDVVCCFDVLEHLPTPMPFFREARRLLRLGGRLVLGTGDSGSLTARLSGSRWTYVSIPEHLSFFNRSSLKTALTKVGFSCVRFKRIHHGERSPSVMRGWMRGVGKHWAVTLCGDEIVRMRVFRQKTADFLVPYFFDHLICEAR
jgi:SAM-dependent methyltransferase